MQKKHIYVAIIIAAVLNISCKQKIIQTNELANKKPNVIVILADDAGYADFGFMGSEDILTPNLDKLAKDGTVFTDAHVSATVCSPSRAGLLTGRYQQRFGHECNLEPDQSEAFDSSEVTLPEALKTAGYKTSIFGKWHLGEDTHQHPLANGFDYFWGFLAGGRSYFPTKQYDDEGNPRAILENHTTTSFDGYLTDAIGEKARLYLQDSVKNGEPFFMYLSFNAPHTPMHAKKEVVEKFGAEHKRPVYAAMLWSMDEAIGAVIQELKRKHIYENTLVFFLSDNGGAHNNNSSVFPLKGWKGNQFEGGSRVPFIMSWKGRLKGDSTYSKLISSLDIYNTTITNAGVSKPIGKPLDGVDLLPYIEGRVSGAPHEKLFWRKDHMSAVRSGDYKLLKLRATQTVLYNIETDLQEKNNLVEQQPEITERLGKELNDWETGIIEPLWIEPEKWNVITQMINEDLMNNAPVRAKDPWQLYNLKSTKENK